MKNRYLIAALLISILSSCAIKKDFLLSPVVPAAHGNVKIDKDKNKNYTIKVRIYNLAAPERVTSHESTYVLWMETAEGEVLNIGQIKSSKATFSKAFKAAFETKSSFRPVKIFLTAEDNSDVKTPDSQIVLSTAQF
jgi:hypothetical protein